MSKANNKIISQSGCGCGCESTQSMKSFLNVNDAKKRFDEDLYCETCGEFHSVSEGCKTSESLDKCSDGCHHEEHSCDSHHSDEHHDEDGCG